MREKAQKMVHEKLHLRPEKLAEQWMQFFTCQRNPILRSELLTALLAGTSLEESRVPTVLLLDVVLLAFAARTYHDAEIVNDFMGLCERTEEEWSRPDWTCRVFNSIHGNAANWILKGSKEFGCSEDRYIPEMVGFYLSHEVPNYFVRELEDSHKKSVVPGSEAEKRTRVK
jgi:hypothetical protein